METEFLTDAMKENTERIEMGLTYAQVSQYHRDLADEESAIEEVRRGHIFIALEAHHCFHYE